MKPEGLRRLTDAIRRDREVEVDADGHVREVPKSPALPEPTPAKNKPTKLAPRTFGVVSSATELLHVTGLESALESAKHVRVFLPVQDELGHPLPEDECLGHVRDALLPIAGGATVMNALGTWGGVDRPVTHEPIRVLESYLVRVPTVANIARLLEVLWRLLRVTRQESIAIAVDGSLFLLSDTGQIEAPRSAA